MTKRSSNRAISLLVVLGLLWLAAVAVCFVGVPRLVVAAYDGQSVDFLNRKFASHRQYRQAQQLDASRRWYANWGREYAIKAVVLATAGTAVAMAFVAVPGVRRRLKRFLFASTAAMNLAVLRVVVFGMLFYLLFTEPILNYAAWPREMFQWPAVGGLILSRLPLSVEIVEPLLVIAMATTAMAAIGFFSRTSGLISIVLATYLLGIPQSSGKVNHMHHVLLIGLLVSLARSGDALSLDSLWQAIRRADRGQVAPPRRAVRYGLPLRLSMVLLALVYFFPGFWKVATNGPEWIFSDNLNNQLLQKWFELEHYRPPLPIHELPFSSQMGALTAVVFELGFVLAIFWRRSRALWAVLGLAFHNLTRLLMNISFMSLQAMYVMFVDWQRLLAWLGRKAYGKPMVLLYDDHCKLCRRTVAILASLDWLSALQPVSAFEKEKIKQLGLRQLEEQALMQDMHAAWQSADGHWHTAKGYAAYQALAWRIPTLWFALLLVYLPPVAMIGRKVYRRVADSRSCQLVSRPASSAAEPPGGRWSARPLLVVAILLLAAQSVLGIARVRKAWPVACYPLFDHLAKPTMLWPEFVLITTDGGQVSLDDDPLRDHLGEARYVVTLKRFLQSPLDADQAKQVLGELRQIWQEAGALDGLRPSSIRVDAASYELTGPERPSEPASSERLLVVPWDQIP